MWAQIPIGQVARHEERARLNAWVYADIRDVDVGIYVERAARSWPNRSTCPQRYSLI